MELEERGPKIFLHHPLWFYFPVQENIETVVGVYLYYKQNLYTRSEMSNIYLFFIWKLVLVSFLRGLHSNRYLF